jgi:hypothetical protein
MTELPGDLIQRGAGSGNVLTPDVLCVSVADQRVYWFKDSTLHKELICSTSKFGISQEEGSNCTPLGLHAIREKIGDGEPVGTVFKGRVPVAYDGVGNSEARITTRILWLEGLEEGFNRGGNVDTHDRYVYLHGTGDESKIGEPDSHGCVHLKAEDLVPLFDEMPSGTLVWIQR